MEPARGPLPPTGENQPSLESLMMLSLSESEVSIRAPFSPGCLHVFARTTITKYHMLGGLNNRNFLSHSPGGWKSKSRHQQAWFLLRVLRKGSVKASLLGCKWSSSPYVSSRDLPSVHVWSKFSPF